MELWKGKEGKAEDERIKSLVRFYTTRLHRSKHDQKVKDEGVQGPKGLRILASQKTIE